MSETVETCGKAYCEHYPEGLPVCSECREASTLAHDIACAKLADARAEIERLKDFINNRDRHLLKCIGQKCDKDKLIEQMREALKGAIRVADRDTVEFDAARVAVSAAEGKE